MSPRTIIGTRQVAAIAGLSVAAFTACNDSRVPEFNAPTSVANTPTGIQNAITGVIAASRNDTYNYVTWMYGFARDATQFQGTENRYITELLGNTPIQPDDFIGATIWDNEFRGAKAANRIIAALTSVPQYSSGDVSTLTGVAQTLKAMNFIWVAETHDTLGVPIYGITQPAASPAPILCNKDVWAYIVALLDSGHTQLMAAPGNAVPVILPAGFAVVSGSSAAFDAFNRALAGKANLELAYAISRPPDSVSVGVSDPAAQAALAKADTDIKASALYNPAALGPPMAGSPIQASDPNGVFLDFSGAAGDQQNTISVQNATLYLLASLSSDLDTLDLRVRNKFTKNDQPNGQGTYGAFLLPCNFHDCGPSSVGVTYAEYPTVASSIPVIRNEELVLLRAQVHIGQGDFAGAATYVNDVRTAVGGRPAYGAPVGTDYVHTREALLHEQRLSTIYEGSGDRTISLRFYGLAASRLNTFPNDLHTTILPITKSEADARNGNLGVTCP